MRSFEPQKRHVPGICETLTGQEENRGTQYHLSIVWGIFNLMVSTYFTVQRLLRYGWGTHPQEQVWARYRWNLALSEAMLPVLAVFEVTFRNQVDKALAELFDEEWLSLDWTIWQKATGRGQRQNREWQTLRYQLDALSRRPVKQTRSHLVASLGLGFWTGLFRSYYHPHIWQRRQKPVRLVFPFAPAMSLHQWSTHLDNIRSLRNRVAHHEAIFDLPHLLQQYEAIYQTLSWIDPKLDVILDDLDHFRSLFSRGWETWTVNTFMDWPIDKDDS